MKERVLHTYPKWSGYDTQPLAWQRGYDWAYDRGEHWQLGCIEAAEAYGYDFDGEDDKLFTAGCEFAQREQEEEL
jgi:hypothetical protein